MLKVNISDAIQEQGEKCHGADRIPDMEYFICHPCSGQKVGRIGRYRG